MEFRVSEIGVFSIVVALVFVQYNAICAVIVTPMKTGM